MNQFLFPFTRRRNQLRAGDLQYATFQRRLFALTIDMILLALLQLVLSPFIPPILTSEQSAQMQQLALLAQEQKITWQDFVLQSKEEIAHILAVLIMTLFAMLAIIFAFWTYKDATPGKLIVRIKIVRRQDLESPKTWQYMLRIIGYIFAPIGVIFMMFGREKRALHDMLASTVVICKDPYDPLREEKWFKIQTALFFGMLIGVAIYILIVKNMAG